MKSFKSNITLVFVNLFSSRTTVKNHLSSCDYHSLPSILLEFFFMLILLNIDLFFRLEIIICFFLIRYKGKVVSVNKIKEGKN